MLFISQLGELVAQTLVVLFDAGLPIETFHLVSHSLGSHLSGFIGRNVISITNGRYTLPRITCLDPAGPLWYGINIFASPVSRRDARFVDVIHTDRNRFGAPVSTGTVDFYPNDGAGIQPGCSRLALPTCKHLMLFFFVHNDIRLFIALCSHHVSWRLWAESLTTLDQTAFRAVQAASWRQFTLGNFNPGFTVQMGVNTPNYASGDWYLQTNGESPRSRDIGFERIAGDE